MLKAVIKVKPEILEDKSSLLPYLQQVIDNINYNYGRNLLLRSWQVDTEGQDEVADSRTVELSME